MQAMVAGIFPVDFNGINKDGWTQLGTLLNKANLLSDTVISTLGLSTGVNSTPNDCIVVAQTIPTATTINAPVYITIGSGTELYPLTKRNCSQVTAAGIRTRTRYSVCVSTTPTGGSFRMIGNPCCSPDNNLLTIDGGAAPAPTA